MEQEMTIEAAFNNVKQVCENHKGPLKDHQAIQHSLKVIQDNLAQSSPEDQRKAKDELTKA